MSCPAAPLRMPPGAKRTPFSLSHGHRNGQVVDPQPDVIERRRVHGGLLLGIDRLHQVHLHPVRTNAHGADVLVDVLAFGAESCR